MGWSSSLPISPGLLLLYLLIFDSAWPVSQLVGPRLYFRSLSKMFLSFFPPSFTSGKSALWTLSFLLSPLEPLLRFLSFALFIPICLAPYLQPCHAGLEVLALLT